MRKKQLVMVRNLLLVGVGVAVITAGLFFLFTWMAYEMRLSLEVIRVLIVLLYICPCICGGELLKKMAFQPSVLWGGGLGAVFYLVICVLALLQGNNLQDLADFSIPTICILSGVLGGFPKRKSTPIT